MAGASPPVPCLDGPPLKTNKTATTSSRFAPDLTWKVGTLNFHRTALEKLVSFPVTDSTLKPKSGTTNGNGKLGKPKHSSTSSGSTGKRPRSSVGVVDRFSGSGSPEVTYIHTIFNTGSGNQAGPSSTAGGGNFAKSGTSKAITGVGAAGGGSGHRGSTVYGQRSSPASVVDPAWELIDPTPDIYALFMEFNRVYFKGTLGSVTVEWSPRMTTCAGICRFSTTNKECKISLSKPLLQLRPRSDLVETLLHEMIHAKLFLKPEGGKHDRTGHGEDFKNHMRRINESSGAKITVFHSFHAEVGYYKTHWWQCVGRCRHQSPFYGMVKRAMNRAPGPSDCWFADHQTKCGGKFIKVREPPKKVTKIKTPKKTALGHIPKPCGSGLFGSSKY